MDLIKGVQRNQDCYDSLASLSQSSLQELDWWLTITPSVNGSPVHLPTLDMVIMTHALKKGWGAVHHSIKTNGK